MKHYIKPNLKMMAVRSCALLDSSFTEKHQVDEAWSKRHNGNDFWTDMESTSSSWPKSKSVWDD